MGTKHFTIEIFFHVLLVYFVLGLLLIFSFTPQLVLAGSNANFQIEILTLCGNGIKETGESCDGADLGGKSCSSQGFTGGVLSCTASCTFNTSACISGRGSAGRREYVAPMTSVIFTGRAYPDSKVTLLKDAQLAAIGTADTQGDFQISLGGVTGGNYMFSLSAEDDMQMTSPLLTFPVSLTTGATTNVSGIFIGPTISMKKHMMVPGDDLVVFGQTYPQADIFISMNVENTSVSSVPADQNGKYLYNFDTSKLAYGNYTAKTRAAMSSQELSTWSHVLEFSIVTKELIIDEDVQKTKMRADLNEDSHVDLMDFSIMAYWYKRSDPPDFVDLNGDSQIDLIDFSIMAFYWTG